MRQDKSGTHFPALVAARDTTLERSGDRTRRCLEELADRLDSRHSFRRGDVVKWKPSLKNRTLPDYGEPAKITALLAEPIFDPGETSAASPYFREPLTVVIAVVRDNELLEYHIDGRRLEPFD
mgnify:CR=1 FL=1